MLRLLAGVGARIKVSAEAGASTQERPGKAAIFGSLPSGSLPNPYPETLGYNSLHYGFDYLTAQRHKT